MLENPQNLINIKNIFEADFKENSEQIPDVIYIPFLNRYENLNNLLSSLSWFNKEIIVLVSNKNDTTKINATKNYQVNFLDCSKFKPSEKIKNLKSFKNAIHHGAVNEWDLPIKRNFAVMHAIQNSFQNMLLIDDDIEGITLKLINKGIIALNSNDIAGCLVEGFPDTSVIGHIEQMQREPYFPFISGNFLFICPTKTDGFFPLIYNEDWLFMIPSIIKNRISAVDIIYQKKSDPFNDLNRIRMQEFGEIIAEGLFELIIQAKFENRFDHQFWNDYISYRRSYVSELLKKADIKHVQFINESLKISKEINAQNCINFVRDWEDDIVTFNKIKNNET